MAPRCHSDGAGAGCSAVDFSAVLQAPSDRQAMIKQALFDFAWKKIERGIVRGFPQWYKQELMEGLFDAE